MLIFDELYSYASRIKTKEYFDNTASRLITNPRELCFDDALVRLLLLCENTSSLDYEDMSDYEKFRFLLSCAKKLEGSGALQIIRRTFDKFFGYSGELDESCAPKLWQDISARLEKREAMSDLTSADGVEYPPVCRPYLDFTSEYSLECEKAIEACASRNTVFIDISEIEFSRTDKYHATMAYDEIKKGKRDKSLTDTALSALIFGVFKWAYTAKREIWLYIGKDLDSAKRLIDYFSDLQILPDLRLFCAPSASLKTASELCGVYGGTRVRYGFCYDALLSVSLVAKNIIEVAGVYPIGETVFAGARTSCPLRSPYHEIFVRGLCRALCELYNDKDKAMSVANHILKI